MINVLKTINLLVFIFVISYNTCNKQRFFNQQIDIRFFDTLSFSIVDMDINRDGKIDKVIFYKFIQGDSLFVYENTQKGYQLNLKTINFTSDWVFVIDSVFSPEKNELVIATHFNGSGGMKKVEHIRRESSKKWILSYTSFERTICSDENNCFEKTQIVNQNFELNENTDWHKYHYFSDINEKCSYKSERDNLNSLFGIAFTLCQR